MSPLLWNPPSALSMLGWVGGAGALCPEQGPVWSQMGPPLLQCSEPLSTLWVGGPLWPLSALLGLSAALGALQGLILTPSALLGLIWALSELPGLSRASDGNSGEVPL